MPMIPVDVDTSTVAITSTISAALAYGMCWSMDLKPGPSVAIAAVVGIGLFSLGIIPIGLLVLFGIGAVVTVGKKLISMPSNVPTNAHARPTNISSTPPQPPPPQNTRPQDRSMATDGVTLQDDPALSGCVNLVLAILESQKQFILAKHNSMPSRALDTFSLGYIAGVSLLIADLQETGPDGFFLALRIALPQLFGEIGKEMIDRVEVFSAAKDPEFVSGVTAGKGEIETFYRQKAEKRNLVLPPMGWAMHAIKE